MTHVTAQITGAAQPHHCVHIGPINIDLPALRVRDPAHLMHRLLKHTMG